MQAQGDTQRPLAPPRSWLPPLNGATKIIERSPQQLPPISALTLPLQRHAANALQPCCCAQATIQILDKYVSRTTPYTLQLYANLQQPDSSLGHPWALSGSPPSILTVSHPCWSSNTRQPQETPANSSRRSPATETTQRPRTWSRRLPHDPPHITPKLAKMDDFYNKQLEGVGKLDAKRVYRNAAQARWRKRRRELAASSKRELHLSSVQISNAL